MNTAAPGKIDDAALATARNYLQRGDIAAATSLMQAQLREHPGDAGALQFLGSTALAGNRPDLAVGYFNDAIRCSQDPGMQAMAWNGLGHAFTNMQNPVRAQEALRHARSLDPANLNYGFDLAAALLNAGQRLLAVETLAACVREHPANADARVRLGNALVQSSRFEEALSVFHEALELDRACASAYYNASVPLAILGRAEKALAACRQALQLDPNLNAYYQLASLGGLDRDSRYRVFAEQRALATELPPEARIDACFAVARVYDHAGDYDRAFEYLRTGNQLKRSTLDFSMDNEVQRINAIIEFFSPDFVRRFTGKTASELMPVFIVGLPRSGSTLLEQMLAAHPAVTACGELDYMTEIAKETGAKWWSDRPGAPGSDAEIAADLRHAADRYRRSLNGGQGIPGRFTDKMLGNFLLLGLIHLLFPRAAILHVRRDPLDTCLSCYDHLFTGHIPYAYDLTELGQYYRLYEKLMQHWHAVLPENRILDVDYETVVARPEQEIRRILEHCGLPFDARCLRHDQVKRAVNTASHSQVRKPVYSSSIGRWRHYAAHLQPLRATLGR